MFSLDIRHSSELISSISQPSCLCAPDGLRQDASRDFSNLKIENPILLEKREPNHILEEST